MCCPMPQKNLSFHRWLFLCMLGFACTACFAGNKGLEKLYFTYSVESFRQYRAKFTVDSCGKFRKEVTNFFMDNFERSSRPKREEGVLSKAEFNHLKRLIAKADIPSMDFSYGFENPTAGDILMELSLSEGSHTHFVEIRLVPGLRFSRNFVRLVSYLNKILK